MSGEQNTSSVRTHKQAHTQTQSSARTQGRKHVRAHTDIDKRAHTQSRVACVVVNDTHVVRGRWTMAHPSWTLKESVESKTYPLSSHKNTQTHKRARTHVCTLAHEPTHTHTHTHTIHTSSRPTNRSQFTMHKSAVTLYIVLLIVQISMRPCP